MGRRPLALSAATWLCALSSVGCDDFDPGAPSQVEGLRILGLSSSAQLVQPGQSITLDALWVDDRPFDDPPDADDAVATAWFAGCTNPEYGSLEDCQEQLNDLEPESGEPWPHEFAPLPGSRAELEVDPNILRGRSDFGLEYFFFAACRGGDFEFSPSRHPNVPITCRDADGNYVHQPDLRLGFRTVTALPIDVEIPATVPVITGFDVDGEPFTPHCVGEECRGHQSPDCDTRTCPRLEAATGRDCSPPGFADCDGSTFRVVVDHDSIGVDYLVSDGEAVLSVEVTARYFVTRGQVTLEGSDILHNREPVGRSDRWDTESQAMVYSEAGERHEADPGQAFLWAVVYDSIGGVTWAGIGIETY